MLNQTTGPSVVAVALQDLSKIPFSLGIPWNPIIYKTSAPPRSNCIIPSVYSGGQCKKGTVTFSIGEPEMDDENHTTLRGMTY